MRYMVSYYICFNYGDDEYGYVLTPEFGLASYFSDYYCEFRIMEAKFMLYCSLLFWFYEFAPLCSSEAPHFLVISKKTLAHSACNG
jgi:hypothetical protein